MSPTVKAYLAASNVTVGGDVTVTSTVKTNATAYASNGSGGLIAIADVSVAIDGTDTNSAFVGTGPDSVSGDSATPQVDATGVTIVAGGNVKVGATTFLRTSASGSSESGGLGDFSHGSASVSLTDHTAAVIGKNAQISGSTVALVSTTGSNGYVAMSVTTYAFIGSATANADYTLTSTVTSILDGDATTSGVIVGVNGVDARAYHDNNSYVRNPDGTCYCIGPSHSNRGGSGDVFTDTASGHRGVTLYVGPRIILGVTTNDPALATPLYTGTGKTALVLFVQGETLGGTPDSGSSRAVHWNSDVVVNSGPSPYLLIGPDGRVVSAVNITVNGVHNPAPGDTLGTHPYIEVNDLLNTNGADVYMTASGGTIDGGSCVGGTNNDACKLGTATGTHYWGTFTFKNNWAKVTIVNQSSRTLVIDDINPLNATSQPTVTLNAPGGSSNPTFAIRSIVDPSLIVIHNSHVSGPELLVNGTINNPLGETDITNDAGPITSSSTRGGVSTFDGTHTSLVRSNVLHLVAGGSIGAAAAYVNVDLIQWHLHDLVVDATAGGSVYLDLLTRVRDHTVVDPGLTPGAAYDVAIGHLVAGDSILLRLQNTLYETGTGTPPGVLVTSTGPSPTGTYYNFYYGNVGSPVGLEEGAFASASHPINSTYHFSLLDAGATTSTGSITVDAASPSDIVDTHRINIVALSEIRGTGNVNMHTSGFITDTEQSGDLRVGEIKSFDDDVTLTSPASIVDAPTGSPIVPITGDAGADVIGVNVTMTAQTAGGGTIGADTNFLEIDSSYDRFGVLTAQAPGVIRITETSGSLNVNTVTTCVTAACADITLTTSAGSVLDGHNGGAGGTSVNVTGNTIDLLALGGSIGSLTNAATGVFTGDLKVDSARGSGCQATYGLRWFQANAADRAVTATCDIAAQADAAIYLIELDGPAAILLARTQAGDIRLTTTETTVEGNDLLVLHSGSTLVREPASPSATPNRQVVPNGLVQAQSGNVLVLSADDVVTDPSAQILATVKAGDGGTGNTTDPNRPRTLTGNIDIHGDWHPGVTDATANEGSVIMLRGEVTPGTGGLTRVYGNAGDDQIFFDQTLLGGNTRAYGSAVATSPGVFAPAGERVRLAHRLPPADDAGGRHDPDPRRPGRYRRLRRLDPRQRGRRLPLRAQHPRQRRPRPWDRHARGARRRQHRQRHQPGDRPALHDR